MKVLVTGATGFIGSHVTDALLAAGCEVRATARLSSKVERLRTLGVDIRTGSLSDSEFLLTACEGVDVAINLAGQLGGWDVRQEELRLANLAVVRKLVCAAGKAGVRQFIQCSTPGVVGMVGVAGEDAPYKPMGEYERTKKEAEEFVLARNSQESLEVTVARPDFVYGPGDLHKLKMFRAIGKRRFPLIAGGKSLLHPTYVTDAAEGIALMVGRQAAFGRVINIAGPRPVSVRELVETIAAAQKVRPPRASVPKPLAWGAAVLSETAARVIKCQPPVTRQQVAFFTMDHASEIARARELIGYEPRVDPDDGIPLTLAWYREGGYI